MAGDLTSGVRDWFVGSFGGVLRGEGITGRKI